MGRRLNPLKKIPPPVWLLWGLFLAWYLFALPRPLFDDPFSTVLEDARDGLLGARIAEDGQWRFPMPDSIPEKYERALISFEDKRFYRHGGIDLFSMARAMRQNIAQRRVVSGGSTITMQVVRLYRKPPSRSLGQKLIEMVLATRLELGNSKKKILRLYAAHAPFGGNVVGLEAASWRYFGKQPHLLSWAEAATLAVLPNSPGLIHPGRNRQALLDKRNRLLERMRDMGILDTLTCELAKEEELPGAPLPLPQLAPHLLERARQEHPRNAQARFSTSIDPNIQRQATQVLERHLARLKSNEIHNAAAIVLDVETGQVLAYVGNVPGAGAQHGEQVDVVRAPRSTGSIMKPFLYALSLQEGIITPRSLLPDIPTSMRGYRPENFSNKYDGAIPAQQALIRSLNIPMVILLQRYGLERFHFQLSRLGFSTFSKPASHYGLSIILGGGECTLEEVTNAYACLARTVNHFPLHSGRYEQDLFRPCSYLLPKKPRKEPALSPNPNPLSASACWLTLEATRQLERPDELGQWERFSSSRPIAWKTGTSFGFRDAWAVGVTPRYAVGIWVGNADGEGRPSLIGIKAAAPILFDLFDLLPGKGPWFQPPLDEMRQVAVCSQSGYRPLAICPTDTLWLPKSALEGPACPFHEWVHLDPSGRYQVNSSCMLPSEMVHEPWFVLPPVQEHYFVQQHPEYKLLPPFREDCAQTEADLPMQLIEPKPNVQILIPRNLDGSLSKTVFQAAHRRPEAVIYWHIDNEFVGKTEQFHNLEVSPPPGEHLLTLVDDRGNRLERKFTILPGKE
ncbi:MAG: penicillin-binding protein 1C [Lewinellaceae bacterium]|nr:penicillin-binding protein 1C [Lewinellaceae bacterium]